MRTSSAKAKGRRLCAYVREKLLEWAKDLEQGDIAVPAGSQPGSDLFMSPLAQKTYPIAWEMKNQESLNIWAALEQAATHAEGTELKPVVAFSRNRSKVYVAMELDDFLWMMR